MGRFTTQICDRCEAHFPLSSTGLSRDWPVREVKWKVYEGSETKVELCKACRAELGTFLYQTFMKKKDKSADDG